MTIPILRKYRRINHKNDGFREEIRHWLREFKVDVKVEFKYLFDFDNADVLAKELKAKVVSYDPVPIFSVPISRYGKIASCCYNDKLVFKDPADELLFKLTWF